MKKQEIEFSSTAEHGPLILHLAPKVCEIKSRRQLPPSPQSPSLPLSSSSAHESSSPSLLYRAPDVLNAIRFAESLYPPPRPTPKDVNDSLRFLSPADVLLRVSCVLVQKPVKGVKEVRTIFLTREGMQLLFKRYAHAEMGKVVEEALQKQMVQRSEQVISFSLLPPRPPPSASSSSVAPRVYPRPVPFLAALHYLETNLCPGVVVTAPSIPPGDTIYFQNHKEAQFMFSQYDEEEEDKPEKESEQCPIDDASYDAKKEKYSFRLKSTIASASLGLQHSPSFLHVDSLSSYRRSSSSACAAGDDMNELRTVGAYLARNARIIGPVDRDWKKESTRKVEEEEEEEEEEEVFNIVWKETRMRPLVTRMSKAVLRSVDPSSRLMRQYETRKPSEKIGFFQRKPHASARSTALRISEMVPLPDSHYFWSNAHPPSSPSSTDSDSDSQRATGVRRTQAWKLLRKSRTVKQEMERREREKEKKKEEEKEKGTETRTEMETSRSKRRLSIPTKPLRPIEKLHEILSGKKWNPLEMKTVNMFSEQDLKEIEAYNKMLAKNAAAAREAVEKEKSLAAAAASSAAASISSSQPAYAYACDHDSSSSSSDEDDCHKAKSNLDMVMTAHSSSCPPLPRPHVSFPVSSSFPPPPPPLPPRFPSQVELSQRQVDRKSIEHHEAVKRQEKRTLVSGGSAKNAEAGRRREEAMNKELGGICSKAFGIPRPSRSQTQALPNTKLKLSKSRANIHAVAITNRGAKRSFELMSRPTIVATKVGEAEANQKKEYKRTYSAREVSRQMKIKFHPLLGLGLPTSTSPFLPISPSPFVPDLPGVRELPETHEWAKWDQARSLIPAADLLASDLEEDRKFELRLDSRIPLPPPRDARLGVDYCDSNREREEGYEANMKFDEKWQAHPDFFSEHATISGSEIHFHFLCMF